MPKPVVKDITHGATVRSMWFFCFILCRYLSFRLCWWDIFHG